MIVLFATFALAAARLASAMGLASPGKDIDAFLGNAYRTEVIGPEMWAHTQRTGQAPLEKWRDRHPGLCGQLHIVHGTDIRDALVPELFAVSGGDRETPVPLTAVRNEWHPSGMLTYYHGGPVFRERKCITADNVFIAEAELKNADPVVRTYRLKLKVHPALPPVKSVAKSALISFRTTSMGKTVPRTTFGCTLSDLGGGERKVALPPNGTVRFRYAFAVGANPDETASAAASALADANVFEANRARVNRWFADHAPYLECDDLDLLHLYYYRWFVVMRGTHDARRVIANHEYPRRAVYESPWGSWYGCVIGLPVPMQIQELAWDREGGIGRDHALNWCEGVSGYRDYIQFTGMSLWRFVRNHPDCGLAAKAARAAAEQAFRQAGGESGALPVQRGSWGTGAEYQPNFYQFTEPEPWDWRKDGPLAKKHGIAELVRLDTAGYAAGSLLGAARLADLAGDAALAKRCRTRAEEMLDLIRRNHWDERIGLFLAADPASGRLADRAACYDSYVPFMWGMVSDGKYARAFDRLTDPAWFWDDFPPTTVAKNCPLYFGGNRIVAGPGTSLENPHKYGCCWNGPAWHYAGSVVAEAFGQEARRNPARRAAWLEFFRRWSATHFTFGDRTVPRAAEHFRPEDGEAIGTVSDYFHSSWIDPFMRYACGICTDAANGGLRFDPFLDCDFRLTGVMVGGRNYGFTKIGKRKDMMEIPKQERKTEK